MALWGTKDTVYSTGNINVNVTTGVVTKQSGSIAWTSGNGVKVGQVRLNLQSVLSTYLVTYLIRLMKSVRNQNQHFMILTGVLVKFMV